MTDLLPGALQRHESPGPRPVDYASAASNGGSTTLSSIAFACSISFLPGCFAAAILHPRIPVALLGSLVALPLAGFVLGLIAKRKYRDADGKARWRARSAVVVGGAELGLVLVAGLLLPNLCRAREPANRVKCANNLRQIGLALFQYANTHGGTFPPTLASLISDPRAELTADVLICPSTTDSRPTGTMTAEQQANAIQTEPGHLSYVYVAQGLSNDKVTAQTVVAYDNPHNHGNEGINVLFGDGHVEFLDKKHADRMRAEVQSGQGPPRVP